MRWTTVPAPGLRWGGRALDFVEARRTRGGGLTGLRFNVGRVEGGIKANMIAPVRSCASASVRCRHDGCRRHAQFSAASPARRAGTLRHHLPRPVAAGRRGRGPKRRLAARDLADELGLPIGNAVDFWTEASLFSAAGFTRFGVRPPATSPRPTRRRMGHAEQLQRYAGTVTASWKQYVRTSTPMRVLPSKTCRPARPSCGCSPAWPAPRRSTSTSSAFPASTRQALRRGEGGRRGPATTWKR